MNARSVPRHFRPGDQVALDDIDGEVVAIRNVNQRRQVVMIKPIQGDMISLMVEIAGGQIMLPPVNIEAAIGLASQIAEGRDPHIPISTQIRALATALLAVTGNTAQGSP